MSRINIGAKPYIMPLPVLMLSAYDAKEEPCAMLAVWGGISHEKEISITVAAQRHTLKGILAKGAFIVSMADVEHEAACDYLGITPGSRVEDKFAKTGFHTTKSEFVDAPLIDELPFAVECRVKSYDPETWRLVGEIVNVSLDERILGEDGKVSFDKFHPLAFDWMNKIYLSLGEKVGQAYHDGMALR
ncbi:flavin reductase family protein [Megasphaera hominis]|jgi:flavin reductase (DIM6/NTAB) family NADH-FMN oxidoreductase RutF|uniref:Flavin reductase n=1 Tax=Megasphaera hominis TaxID=159836 RepID=A0ABR6VKH8_9FIRM|nr:flavin reductase [Megasphaera hominis]MBC3537790.1 flavin reductase [Megasphaera hominis]